VAGDPGRIDVDAVMAELHGRVRERLRRELVEGGGSRAFADPALFAEIEAILHAAATTPDTARLVLPELLGDPDTWRLTTSMRYGSHRGRTAARFLIFLKQRVLMPVLRWLYEYSRDNFERQRRTNHVLFACVQELAVETALLRRDVRRLAASLPTAAGGARSPVGRGEPPVGGGGAHPEVPSR
jgi:hypothetical protein